MSKVGLAHSELSRIGWIRNGVVGGHKESWWALRYRSFHQFVSV